MNRILSTIQIYKSILICLIFSTIALNETMINLIKYVAVFVYSSYYSRAYTSLLVLNSTQYKLIVSNEIFVVFVSSLFFCSVFTFADAAAAAVVDVVSFTIYSSSLRFVVKFTML